MKLQLRNPKSKIIKSIINDKQKWKIRKLFNNKEKKKLSNCFFVKL